MSKGMRINIAICLVVLVSCRAIGQSADARLTFEVASVKPSGPEATVGLTAVREAPTRAGFSIIPRPCWISSNLHITWSLSRFRVRRRSAVKIETVPTEN